MTEKYHISKNGEVVICRAEERKCPLGGQHFTELEKAYLYADRVNEYALSNGLNIDEAKENIYHIDKFEYYKTHGIEYSTFEAKERGEWVAKVAEKALKEGKSTENIFGIKDEKGNIIGYTDERKKQQDYLIKKLLQKYKDVPSNQQVIFSAGAPGAGKTTILNQQITNSEDYATVSSDDFKELMAEHGMIPKVEGLTPMESSTLVHEESSYLADRLAMNLAHLKKNIIYDFTCKTVTSATYRINLLKKFGYETKKMNFIFVNIPLVVSKERAKNRYVRGLNKFNIGGRWLPEFVIDKSSSKTGKFDSQNAESIVDLYKNYGINKPLVFDNTNSPTQLDFNEFMKGYKS